MQRGLALLLMGGHADKVGIRAPPYEVSFRASWLHLVSYQFPKAIAWLGGVKSG